MKDEIKEILEDVKRHLDYVEATKQCSIRDNEMKVMYDYITNLQEENERLKEKIEHLLIDLDGESEYKIINEKAIEYIDRRDIEWGSDEHTKLLNILQGDDKE